MTVRDAFRESGRGGVTKCLKVNGHRHRNTDSRKGSLCLPTRQSGFHRSLIGKRGPRRELVSEILIFIGLREWEVTLLRLSTQM